MNGNVWVGLFWNFAVNSKSEQGGERWEVNRARLHFWRGVLAG